MRVQKRCQYSLGGTGMRQHCRFIIAALFGYYYYYYYYGTAAYAATGSVVVSLSQKQSKRGISTTSTSGTEECAASLSDVEARLLPVLRLTHTQSWYPSIAAAGLALAAATTRSTLQWVGALAVAVFSD